MSEPTAFPQLRYAPVDNRLVEGTDFAELVSLWLAFGEGALLILKAFFDESERHGCYAGYWVILK